MLCGGVVAVVLFGCGHDYVDRSTNPRVISRADTVYVSVPCEPETVYIEVDDDKWRGRR